MQVITTSCWHTCRRWSGIDKAAAQLVFRSNTRRLLLITNTCRRHVWYHCHLIAILELESNPVETSDAHGELGRDQPMPGFTVDFAVCQKRERNSLPAHGPVIWNPDLHNHVVRSAILNPLHQTTFVQMARQETMRTTPDLRLAGRGFGVRGWAALEREQNRVIGQAFEVDEGAVALGEVHGCHALGFMPDFGLADVLSEHHGPTEDIEDDIQLGSLFVDLAGFAQTWDVGDQVDGAQWGELMGPLAAAVWTATVGITSLVFSAQLDGL